MRKRLAKRNAVVLGQVRLSPRRPSSFSATSSSSSTARWAASNASSADSRATYAGGGRPRRRVLPRLARQARPRRRRRAARRAACLQGSAPSSPELAPRRREPACSLARVRRASKSAGRQHWKYRLPWTSLDAGALPRGACSREPSGAVACRDAAARRSFVCISRQNKVESEQFGASRLKWYCLPAVLLLAPLRRNTASIREVMRRYLRWQRADRRGGTGPGCSQEHGRTACSLPQPRSRRRSHDGSPRERLRVRSICALLRCAGAGLPLLPAQTV
jgi:hypothetical protein